MIEPSTADIIAEAKHIIESDLRENITLQQLADRLYVGRTRLCTAFRKEVGMTVGAYSHAIRLEKAKELLRDTDELVSDISVAVGYARHSSFAERFKQETGVTPTEWRQRYR